MGGGAALSKSECLAIGPAVKGRRDGRGRVVEKDGAVGNSGVRGERRVAAPSTQLQERNGWRKGGRSGALGGVCKSKDPHLVHNLIQSFLFWLSGQASSTFLPQMLPVLSFYLISFPFFSLFLLTTSFPLTLNKILKLH